MKKTILIVGISSFVGTNLALALKDEYRVVGTYYRTPVEIRGIMCLPCDVMKKEYVTRIIGMIKPDFIIYAAGLSSLTECRLKPKLADALNSGGAINCMGAAERSGAKFIYLSSAYVMEGQNVIYTESDTPFPITAYGTSLASTEFFVQRSSLNYFILRCPVLYGRSIQTEHENFYEIMQRQFSRGEVYLADGSITTGFLDVAIMAEFLKICIANNITNRLLQVSSSDFMTRYDFARKYAQIFKKDENLVHRSDVMFPLDDKGKSKDKTSTQFFKLSSTNIETELGMKMPSVEESLKETLKRIAALT